MTDKVQKIREEVARIQFYTQSEVLKQVLDIIDNVQEEPVDYDKLKEQLHNTLAKETKESLNEFLDEEECNITGIGVREKVTGKLREMLDKKDYRERYKRIAESEQFKKTHEGMSIGEVMHIEGEEPVSKQSVDEAMAEVEQKIQSFTQAHVGENADEILAHMRGEKPVSEEFEKAATKYAEKKCFLENAVYTDGEMLMAKAKPRFDFYDIATAFEDGAKWQKRKDNQPVSEDEIEKQFKAGDVVMYVSRHPAYSGLYLLGNPNDLSIGYSNADEPYQIALRNCTAASEDERRQFMRELNNNGYKWNECTLRIEKKEEPVSEDLGEYINELSKQFPEVSFAKLSRIAVRVAKWQTLYDMGITERKAQNTVQDILKNGDELEAFATEIAFKMFPANLQEPYHDMHRGRIVDAVMYGAEWQKENLWKPADGDDLPEIDREVVVFTQDFPNDAGIMSVAIAHRPNPDGWDGKSLSTGKVEHYTPKTYDKGGWNIPDIKFWLDVELPKEIEL